MSLIKSKKRFADHGEVFAPAWLVDAMLDLVKDESERIDSRFLEPACGSGNFIVKVLQRKLAAVECKFGKSDFEKQHYALRDIHADEDLPTDDGERVGCSGGRINMAKIDVKGTSITVISGSVDDYISLTDIDRYKDSERTDYIIQNRLRNRNTIEFLGIWEQLNNLDFNPIEFDGIRRQAGLNSVVLNGKQP